MLRMGWKELVPPPPDEPPTYQAFPVIIGPLHLYGRPKPPRVDRQNGERPHLVLVHSRSDAPRIDSRNDRER
jgi:hypothetical protein